MTETVHTPPGEEARDASAAAPHPARNDRQRDYSGVSPAVIKRLPRYYRYLRELLRKDILRISSGELSALMNVTASQIRQDLNCFGGFGQQGYGYNVKYLYSKISDILGVTAEFRAIVIGAGNLGRAVTGSNMFEHRGVTLSGLFDVNSDIIGRRVGEHTVLPMASLHDFLQENPIDIAILTVPKEMAVEAAGHLVGTGIRGIWNFTSTELDGAPLGMIVENVHMGDSLMTLMYEINMNETIY